MNLIPAFPVALIQLAPATQVLALFFAGWVLILFLVLLLDGNRAR